METTEIEKLVEINLQSLSGSADSPCFSFLPYSGMFDCIEYFQNVALERLMAAALMNTLPQRSHYANDIDLWIDLESQGEITILQAKALARVMADYIQSLTVKEVRLCLGSRNEMTRDNHYFLHYLKKLTSKVTLVYRPTPKNPGLNDLKYLRWSCFPKSGELDYTSHPENILQHAWRCAELGAEELAFKIINTGIEKASLFYIKQLYLVQLQFMRIATQYYEAAAQEDKNISIDNCRLHHSFHLTKAWGNTLCRRIVEASHYFEAAKVSMNYSPADLDDLYRMNIFALFQHLSGNTENAFIIENKIKHVIKEASKPYPQITYINSINLARLYRYIGDYDQAKIHYDRAFNTQRGKKSETDLIYANVCYAMLYEKQNQLALALQYWINAALHWLNAETPESLGWRAVRAIALSGFKPRSPVDTAIIDAALLKKIKDLGEKTQCHLVLAKEESAKNNLIVLTKALINH